MELALWHLGCVLKLAALQSKLLSSESHLLASGLCFKAGPDPTVCGLGTGAWGLGSRIFGLGAGVWDLGSRIFGLGVWCSGFAVWSCLGSWPGVWGREFGVQDLGSWVWCGVRVWGLGPGVLGLGSGVRGEVLGLGPGVLDLGSLVLGHAVICSMLATRPRLHRKQKGFLDCTAGKRGSAACMQVPALTNRH